MVERTPAPEATAGKEAPMAKEEAAGKEKTRAEEAPPVVEPRLGLGDFAAVAQLDTVTQAGLRMWMRTKGYRPDGHFPLAQWQEYHQQLLEHTG